ncbi:MAG: glycosyl hydrolase, partial [Verrucomicrobia bacterium]|nr:glycosyl hydrolase [Verrucomicrobiota bacterium]
MKRTLMMVWLAGLGLCAATAGDLEKNFAHSPDSAKPLAWWHWLDGNITSNGITGDLEAMKRAGLGGTYLFNSAVGFPDGPVRFMQPQWLALMDHTLNEAKRLGLQFGIHNCDGFSQSGGPWITPETSMKELTWTVKEVEGPAAIDLALAQPETKENFYRDIAVVAFPVPQGRVLTGQGTDTTLRGSVATAELAKLVDGKPETKALFPTATNGNTVEFVFPTPRTVRSLVCRNASPHKWEEDFPIAMEVSSDGQNFRRVGAFTAS